MEQLIQQLRNSDHLLIVSHVNLDGDAVGSLLATGLALAMVTDRVTIFSETPVPVVYRFLPSSDCIVHDFNDSEPFDTVIVLDCADLDRVGESLSRIRRIPVLINIDHHITNTGFGDYQWVDSNASATAEIVYRLISGMKIPIDRAISTAIYTGILTDTGSFRFSNTTREAFAICEEMVKLGVNPYNVAQHVYGTYSLGRIKLLLLALDSIEISQNGRMSMMVLSREMLEQTATSTEDIEGLVNYARNIKDVELAVLIQEKDDDIPADTPCGQFHVSLRSDGLTDVSAIAASFGGGGHSVAAGFSIESTLFDLKERLFALAETL